MRQAISHVKHPDKHKCVMLCIEKERQRFECIRPISKAYRYRKHYGHNGEGYGYKGTLQESFYEAVYRRRM